jgi:sec-independent protein translocase protein TatA
VRPRTGFPAASVTVAYTSIAVVDEVNCGAAARRGSRGEPERHATRSAASAPARSGVILFGLVPHAPQGVVMIGRFGIPELIVILLIILVLFGASRLPEIGRGIGKGIRNFKDATKEGEKDRS